jgi:hypothetical protein
MKTMFKTLKNYAKTETSEFMASIVFLAATFTLFYLSIAIFN